MRKLKLFLDAKAANTPPRGISKASRVIFSVLTLLFLSIGQVWGAVVSGTTYNTTSTSSVPSGWSAAGTGTSYIQMTSADHYIQTDEFCAKSFTSIKLKARKYQGPNATQLVISVDWVVGSSTTTLGTISPTGTSLTDYTISSPASITADKEGYIKISCKGASDGKGSGVSQVTITYTSGNCIVADPHKVSFSTGAGNPTQADITETTAGAGIELPAGPTPACSADGWVFAGWKETSAVASETTTAPTLLAAGTNYKPAADCILYAVYKRTESGAVTDQDVTETFENQTAESTYNTTKNYEASASNAKKAWTMYYGCVSTDVKLAGNKSAQMRWYKSATSNLGYIQNATPISGLQSVSFKAKANNANSATTKISVWYSTDGDSWTKVKDNEAAPTSTETISATINGTVGTDYYVRIGIGDNGTAPSSGSTKLVIDDVQFNYKAAPTTTYYLSAPTCCEKKAITIASGIENGTVEADLTEACEGATVTLTFTPAGSYHLDSWSVNGTEQDIAENTFTMPATAVTVSATFAHDACENLDAPTLNGTIEPTYNSATIAWNEVSGAVAYAVSVVKHGEAEPVFSGNVTDLSKALDNLEPETQYDYTIMAIGDGTVKCADGNGELVGNFTTEALPTAHLTLMNLGVEHASSGDYAILTPFNLPTTAAACSKAFVGWDANPDCATAPTYAKGAEFTFANTTGVTLYAVYADAEAGDVSYTKLTSDAFDAEATYIIAAAQTTSDATMWYFNSCANTDQNNSYGFMTTDPENNAPIQFQLSGTASALKIREVSGAKRYLKGLTTGNFQMSASEQTLTLSNAGAIGSSSNYILRHNYNSGNGGLRWYSSNTGTIAYLYKVEQEFTYSNYATTCVEAPTAEPASASIAVAAAGGEGTLGISYENVNLAGVTVALYNNEACTEAFDGGWLTASIAGDDKHIAYNAQANTSYNDARTAYIKLTAPETTGATAPAVVVIPVSQAKKAAVFSSLEELVAADVNANTNVTVSFSNVVIKDIYYYNSKRRGLIFDIQKADADIKIYYNADVPAEWVAGGKVSGTLTDCPWKIYSGAWQLAPASGFVWTTDLSYTAPKAVSSVVVSGNPSKDTYVDGEKFNPAGLTVTVNYNDATSEVNPTGVTFACDPVRVAKSDDPVSVSVVATFNEIDSDPFEVTGLTVGDIQTKTIAQFIEAGNADMRCYLEGTVSDIETGTKLKYGNFNLTDASGTIYIYGCLDQNGDAEQFESLGVNNGDKIKVLAEDYEYYNSKNEAKNVQFVSKTPAATISIDDIDMETGDELALSSIVATITPAAAQSATISYEVTEGAAVSISEGKIIAEAAGEATITASIATTDDYIGASVEFTVTVTAPDTRKIATASAFTALSGDMSPADISFAAYKGDGTNAPVVRSGDNPVTIRLYKPDTNNNKNTGNYLTLTAKVGCTIDQVKIEFSGNADAAYCKDAEALPTSKYIEGVSELLTPTGLAAQSVSIVNLKNGSIDVAAITVWYNGDPLAVHHYILGGTYPTEFEQYGTFSYEGLTVTAAYDEQETITEPVSGFTAEADLMTAGDKKAKVYLNEVEIAEYDITVTASSKQNPALAYDPTSDEITLGDAWTAPTLDNPLNVEGISFSSNNTSVAKVSAAGVITLQGATGTATITASFAETEAYVASSATYTITVNEPAEVLGGKWELVNEVLPGMRIIIANEASAGAIKTMGMQNSNNRAAVASSVDANGILTPAAGTKTFLVVATETEGQYALQARNGNYIYAASNSSNHLKEEASIDVNGNANWTIEIDANGVATIKAQGNNSSNWIRYNTSGLFSCYGATNTQEDVYVYAWKPYTRTVSGNYGTICLPKAGVMTNGVLYEISYYDADQKKIFFDEVEGGVMVAGAPYIFKPNENVTELKVAYTDATVVENAGHKNGLYGHYDLNNPTEGAEAARLFLAIDDYFLLNNEYWKVDQENRVYVDNYRAYIKLDKIGNDVTPQAYGRRRVSLNVNGEQVATGMDELNASEAPVKMMINGQLFILRGEKLYDTTGRLVK